jgi:hypothetical protein
MAAGLVDMAVGITGVWYFLEKLRQPLPFLASFTF